MNHSPFSSEHVEHPRPALAKPHDSSTCLLQQRLGCLPRTCETSHGIWVQYRGLVDSSATDRRAGRRRGRGSRRCGHAHPSLSNGLVHQVAELLGAPGEARRHRPRPLGEPPVAPDTAPLRLLPAVALEIERQVDVEVRETIGVLEQVRAQISTHLVEAHEAVDLSGQRLIPDTAPPQDPAQHGGAIARVGRLEDVVVGEIPPPHLPCLDGTLDVVTQGRDSKRLVDHPVAEGDFCRFGDQVGTVEEFGLRSTRVRTLDRTVVTVPNAEFSAMKLENYAKRDRIRFHTILGLRYETTPDQLRHVLVEIRRLLLSHAMVTPDPARVRFVGFGAYSLDVEITSYVSTSDWAEFLAVREDLLLRLMDIVASSGAGFAFPSQTTYIARDDGLDGERVRSAEEQVRAWRERSELPLPDFAEDSKIALDDTVRYPPEGSAASNGK